MAKYNTLTDLNAFLEEQGANAMPMKVETKEEFMKQVPNQIVQVVETPLKVDAIAKYTSIEELAILINEMAIQRGTSYAEVCLDALEKGSEITPILKGGGMVTTWFNANKTALNVIRNTIKSKLGR